MGSAARDLVEDGLAAIGHVGACDGWRMRPSSRAKTRSDGGAIDCGGFRVKLGHDESSYFAAPSM